MTSIKETFTHKLGPLPAWAWVGIGAGIGFLYLSHHKKSTTTTAGIPGATLGYGGVPGGGGSLGGGLGNGGNITDGGTGTTAPPPVVTPPIIVQPPPVTPPTPPPPPPVVNPPAQLVDVFLGDQHFQWTMESLRGFLKNLDVPNFPWYLASQSGNSWWFKPLNTRQPLAAGSGSIQSVAGNIAPPPNVFYRPQPQPVSTPTAGVGGPQGGFGPPGWQWYQWVNGKLQYTPPPGRAA